MAIRIARWRRRSISIWCGRCCSSYQGEPKDAVAFFRRLARRAQVQQRDRPAQYGLVASLLRLKDYGRAKKELAKLEKLAPQHPMIDAMAGHVLLDSGDVDGAIKRFEAGVNRYPDKMQLVYDYPEALAEGGTQCRGCRNSSSGSSPRFPNDGPLQLLAARAYAAQNKQMLAHHHQGEYYAWQGNLKGAIDQLEIASKAKDGDFYQASVVDTRLRTLKREMAEQDKSAFAGSG